MNRAVNIFPRMGFAIVIILLLGLVPAAPAWADHDEYLPGPEKDREIYFYQDVYPYRRHWHHEKIPAPKPLTRSEILKRKQELNRAKSLERGQVLKEIQQRNRAKSLERGRVLKEIQERNRAKALERSRALKEIQEKNKARALENRRR